MEEKNHTLFDARGSEFWKTSPCKVDGKLVYRIERQTGPNAVKDYEFAKDETGEPLEFPNTIEADGVVEKMNLRDFYEETT